MERSVSLILILIDDLTGRRILQSFVKPWIDWEKAPVWKKGYYIFTDLKQSQCLLHLESRQYVSEVYPVSLLQKQVKEMKIRMKPSDQYPYTEDVVVVRGTGTPGERVSMSSQENRFLYRLSRNYKQGETIQVSHGEQFDFSGKKAVLQNRNTFAFIQMGNLSEEKGMVYPVHILSKGKMEKESKLLEFQKINTTVSFLYETTIRDDGTFRLVMPGKRNSICPVMLYYKEKFQSVMAEEGRLYHLDSDIDWNVVE